MCDSKRPIRQVPKNVKEAKKTHKRPPPTQPEIEHPAKKISPESQCDAISLGRRPSYQGNPKNGPKDDETQKFAYFTCATVQTQDALTLTADVSSVCCTVFVVFADI